MHPFILFILFFVETLATSPELIAGSLNINPYGSTGLQTWTSEGYVDGREDNLRGYFPVVFLETGTEGKFIGLGRQPDTTSKTPDIFNSAGTKVSKFCGLFNQITQSWSGFKSPDDLDGPVFALATITASTEYWSPSPSAPLYVGGAFSKVGGVEGTKGIASWTGTNWQSVGGGIGGSDVYQYYLGINDPEYDRGFINGIVFFDGYLYVTGSFNDVRQSDDTVVLNTRNVARFNTLSGFWSSIHFPTQEWTRGTSVSLMGSSIVFTGVSMVTEEASLHSPIFIFQPTSLLWEIPGNNVWSSGTSTYIEGVSGDKVDSTYALDKGGYVAIYSIHVTSSSTFYASGNFLTGAGSDTPYFAFWDGISWASPGGQKFIGETYSSALVNSVLIVVGIRGFIRFPNKVDPPEYIHDYSGCYLSTRDISNPSSQWKSGLAYGFQRFYVQNEDTETMEYRYNGNVIGDDNTKPKSGAFFSVYLSSCSGSQQLFLGGSITNRRGDDATETGLYQTSILRVVNVSSIGTLNWLPSCPLVPTSLPTPSSEPTSTPTSSMSPSPSSSSDSSSTPLGSVSSSSSASASISPRISSAASFSSISSFTSYSSSSSSASSTSSASPSLSSSLLIFDTNALITAASSSSPPLSTAEISGIASAGVVCIAVFFVMITRFQSRQAFLNAQQQNSQSSVSTKVELTTGYDIAIEPSRLVELASMSALADSPRVVQLPRNPRNTLSIRNLTQDTESIEHTSLRLRTLIKTSRSETKSRSSR